MDKNQEYLGIKCKNKTDAIICFSELIQKTNKKYSQKVVILTDEYDKPILDNITNDGRTDLTVIINGKVYIFEFKVLNSTPKNNTALNQIIKNNYHEKYITDYDEIYLIVIVFNENKRNIVKFNSKNKR